METMPAIVDESAIRALRMAAQSYAEAAWHEHTVWIHFRCPPVALKSLLRDDLAPHTQEDWRIEGRAVLAPIAALETAIKHAGVESRTDLPGDVAIDRCLLASEDAHALTVLRRYQGWLVAERQHERKAEK
jgi:hypothetical protein